MQGGGYRFDPGHLHQHGREERFFPAPRRAPWRDAGKDFSRVREIALAGTSMFFENWGSEGKDPGGSFLIASWKRAAASEERGVEARRKRKEALRILGAAKAEPMKPKRAT